MLHHQRQVWSSIYVVTLSQHSLRPEKGLRSYVTQLSKSDLA